jgi:short-subunit dehydrogenase
VSAVRGRVVAVTGGARGIGLAIGEALARRGALVALGDLDGEVAAREAHRIGVHARGFALDVTDEGSFARFLDDAAAAFGRPLDVLVNNAGIMWVGPFAAEPEDAALRQMAVNFHGVARGMRLALPAMRARGRGHVVNVASASSRLPTAGEATYSATKHAVLGYSAAVREELRGSGVEVSVVMPVVVETELAAGTSHGKGVRLAPADVAAAVVAAIERPRFEVFVPRAIGAWTRLLALLPQRGRDALYAAMMPDQVAETDQQARAAYEQRALSRL